MNNILAEIIARKKSHITQRKQQMSLQELQLRVSQTPPPRGFATALKHKLANSEVALIAELKKASPSKGMIRADFDIASLARAYEQGGAACLSVLTDTPYFSGEDRFVRQAKEAVSLPVLRKDFIIDPYQVWESRALGADCILLIMAALSDTQAMELEALAHELNMDVLIESHDEEEMQRALTHLSSTLIGINNRNLKTLEVSLDTARTLAPLIPVDKIGICESGIYSSQDIEVMREHGLHTFLVGESLMRQPDVRQATKMLLGK